MLTRQNILVTISSLSLARNTPHRLYGYPRDLLNIFLQSAGYISWRLTYNPKKGRGVGIHLNITRHLSPSRDAICWVTLWENPKDFRHALPTTRVRIDSARIRSFLVHNREQCVLLDEKSIWILAIAGEYSIANCSRTFPCVKEKKQKNKRKLRTYIDTDT